MQFSGLSRWFTTIGFVVCASLVQAQDDALCAAAEIAQELPVM